jgi:hypothetical protein
LAFPGKQNREEGLDDEKNEVKQCNNTMSGYSDARKVWNRL